MTKNTVTNLAVIFGILFFINSFILLYIILYYTEDWISLADFQENIHLGMKANNLIESIGKPDKIFNKGCEYSVWSYNSKPLIPDKPIFVIRQRDSIIVEVYGLDEARDMYISVKRDEIRKKLGFPNNIRGYQCEYQEWIYNVPIASEMPRCLIRLSDSTVVGIYWENHTEEEPTIDISK